MYTYIVILRCDWEDYFCTETTQIQASSLLEAAQIAEQTLTNTRTVWLITRKD